MMHKLPGHVSAPFPTVQRRGYPDDAGPLATAASLPHNAFREGWPHPPASTATDPYPRGARAHPGQV